MTPQDRTAIRSGLVAALLWGGAAGVGVHPLAGVLAALVAGFTATGFRLPASLVRDAAASVWSGTKKATGLRSASIPVKYVVPLLLLTSLSGRGCDGITLPDVKWPNWDWRTIVEVLPDPTPTTGPIFGVVVFDTERGDSLTREQDLALESADLDAYLASHGLKENGHVEWREWDDDKMTADVLVEESARLRDAYAKARQESNGNYPHIVVSNGKDGYSGPLPATGDELLTLLKKYGG